MREPNEIVRTPQGVPPGADVSGDPIRRIPHYPVDNRQAEPPKPPPVGKKVEYQVVETLSKKVTPQAGIGQAHVQDELLPGRKYRITCMQGGGFTDISPPVWDPSFRNQDGTFGAWVQGTWTFIGPSDFKETFDLKTAKYYKNIEKRHCVVDPKTKDVDITLAYVGRFLVQTLEQRPVAH